MKLSLFSLPGKNDFSFMDLHQRCFKKKQPILFLDEKQIKKHQFLENLMEKIDKQEEDDFDLFKNLKTSFFKKQKYNSNIILRSGTNRFLSFGSE